MLSIHDQEACNTKRKTTTVAETDARICTSVWIPDQPSRSIGWPFTGWPGNLNGLPCSILSGSIKLWLGAIEDARKISALNRTRSQLDSYTCIIRNNDDINTLHGTLKSKLGQRQPAQDFQICTKTRTIALDEWDSRHFTSLKIGISCSEPVIILKGKKLWLT